MESSGTLVLTAHGADQLTGVMTDVVTGVTKADDLGPLVDHATLEVRARDKRSRFMPKGAFEAAVFCSPDGRWIERDDDQKPIGAWLDMRACADEPVPRLRHAPIDGFPCDDSDSDSSSVRTVTASSSFAERRKVVNRVAPPLLLRTGDLRLTVQWGEEGADMAYLLRRAQAAGGAPRADAVSAPCAPAKLWVGWYSPEASSSDDEGHGAV